MKMFVPKFMSYRIRKKAVIEFVMLSWTRTMPIMSLLNVP